jgi:hypothetical protein
VLWGVIASYTTFAQLAMSGSSTATESKRARGDSTEKEASRRRDEVARLKRECGMLEDTLRKQGRPAVSGGRGGRGGGGALGGGGGGEEELEHRSYENLRTAELPTGNLAALQRTMLCGASPA